MRRATDDVLAREEPVAPAEAADVVESLEEEDRGLGVFDGVFLHANLAGLFADVSQELAVRARAVSAELVQDLGEGSLGHGDFAEVVEDGDLVR